MKKIRKILAPTDLSELSRLGVRYALEMAKELGAVVIVHHVVPIGEDWFSRHENFAPARELLAREKASLEQFLGETVSDSMNVAEIRQRVEIGSPYANIVELAESEGVDMIVMSTHGRTGFDHMLMGSVTEKVVARAPCPVLVIPRHGRRAAIADAA
jgi:nucleotide-binding universal stress UspA family protein